MRSVGYTYQPQVLWRGSKWLSMKIPGNTWKMSKGEAPPIRDGLQRISDPHDDRLQERDRLKIQERGQEI